MPKYDENFQDHTDVINDSEEPPLISKNTQEFKNKFYPNTTLEEWNDSKWQIQNSITSLQQLEKILVLTENEYNAFKINNNLPFRVTPYYMSLVINSNELRKTVIPTIHENIYSDEESDDPLDEEKYRHGCVIHKYPDRALFLSTNFCSTYCRYCTRSRIMHKEDSNWEEGLNYIREHKEIHDVIVSGGDALLLKLEKLDYLLNEIRNIKHIEIIRIGTKAPIVLPQRINDHLINILSKYQPLYINIHIMHPDELTMECKEACNKLINSGFVLGSQTVLVKNINDNIKTMELLMRELLKMRIRPYYLYSCDFIKGSSHFRCKIEKGIEIIKDLRNNMSGLGIPSFIIDTKTKKVPIIADYQNEINEYLNL